LIFFFCNPKEAHTFALFISNLYRIFRFFEDRIPEFPEKKKKEKEKRDIQMII